MHKIEKFLLLFAGLSLLSLFLATFALAAPSGPANVVNHKTKECAVIPTKGDECQTCVPTGDWEILIGDCPDGYTKLDTFAPISCHYSGNPISMCDYVKAEYLAKDPNTIIFLSGLVVVALLAVIFIWRNRSKVVHD